eukprot:5469889-Pleurochrysis_carterae.AAC.4
MVCSCAAGILSQPIFKTNYKMVKWCIVTLRRDTPPSAATDARVFAEWKRPSMAWPKRGAVGSVRSFLG